MCYVRQMPIFPVRGQGTFRTVMKHEVEYLVEEDIRFVLNKLGMSRTDLEEIMNQPNKSFMDYKTYYPVIIKLRFFLSLAQKLGLYPDKIYGKYSY